MRYAHVATYASASPLKEITLHRRGMILFHVALACLRLWKSMRLVGLPIAYDWAQCNPICAFLIQAGHNARIRGLSRSPV